MTKDDLIRYGLISLGVVVGARFFATAVFAWIEESFTGKRSRDKSLEELVRGQRYSMGALSEKEAAKRPPGQLGDGKKHAELGEFIDPKEAERRAIMHRIFDVDLKRGQQESEAAFQLRILGLSQLESPELIKKAYKQRAKECHPDRFALGDFDQKTRKRLETRIHENYLAVQRAYEFFSKKK